VATADVNGYVNVSPKGLDSLRVLNSKQVLWLNLTGSGNETAAHVQSLPRMTLMFCAFDGNPMVLRLYGKAQVIHKNDTQWQNMASQFDDYLATRQIFLLDIELVQTSCGMAVPLFDFNQQRDHLLKSAQRKGTENIKLYWRERNQISLNGKPTNIVSKNL
jgi:hypothetical protein